MRSRKTSARRRAVVSAAVAASLVSLTGPQGRATDLAWDAGGASPLTPAGGTGNWNTTGAVWSNGAADVAWNNATPGGDVAIFGGTAGTVTISTGGSGIVAGGVTFNTGGYTVNAAAAGDTLTLLGPTVTVTNATDAATIAAVLAGTAGVNKAGAGALTLSGANTFTGGFTLAAGTLNINGVTALGDATNTFAIAGGTTLDNTSAAAVTLANNYAMAWNGDFAFTGTRDLNLGTGAVAMSAARTVTIGGGTLTVGGAVGGAGLDALNITKNGAGTLALTNATAITITAPRSVAVNAGTMSVAAQVTGAGLSALDITKTGAGTLSLTDATSISLAAPQTVTVAGGTMVVAAPIANATFGLTKAGAGALTLSGVIGPGGGGVSVTGGTLTLANAANTFTGAASVTGGGVLEAAADGSLGAAPAAFTAAAVTLDGGTLRSIAGANATVSVNRGITIGAGGGTIHNNAATAEYRLHSVISGPGQLTLQASGTGNLVIDNNTGASGVNLSTYAGGTVILPGGTGAIIPIQSSAGAPGAPTSGPFGTGTIDFAGGVFRPTGVGAVTLHNAIRLSADMNMQGGGAALTLLGPVTLAGGNRTWSAPTTVTFAGPIGDGGNGYSFTKTGAGSVVLSAANTFSGGATVSAGTLQGNVVTTTGVFGPGPVGLAGGTLNVFFDGDTGPAGGAAGNGTGAPQTVVVPNALNVTGSATLGVNRLGTSYGTLYTTAANKTAQFAGLTIGSQTLTVANSSGYGALVAGTTALSGAPNFTVSTATASNLVPGLTLGGAVTGTTTGVTKAGAGTLVLGGASSTFTGNLTVTAGVLGATSDGALGSAANTVTLNGATAGFEAFDTFATSRSFTFANATAANNVLLVAAGKTLTVNSALTGANGFTKSDPGVLVLAGGSGGFSGPVSGSGGVIRLGNSAALGTAAVTMVGNTGTALQLDGTGGPLTIGNAVTINGTGLNTGGSLQSVAGANTVTGAVTLGSAATIGVDAGSTLTLGAVTGTSLGLTLSGGGSGTINGLALATNSSLTKVGPGGWTLAGTSTFSSTTGSQFNVLNGTLTLAGGATYTGTGTPILSQAATLVLDNSVTNNNNRMNGRFSNMWFAGELRIIGNAAAATTESTGGAANFTPANAAGTITLLPNAAQPVTFGSAATFPLSRAGTSTLLFRAPGLGGTLGAGTGRILFSGGTGFTGQAGAAGTTNRGIFPYALADTTSSGFGTAFATYDATNGVRPLGQVAGESVATLVSNANVVTSTGLASTAATFTVNSLTLNGGGGVTLSSGSALLVDSGGVLALNGNTGIAGPSTALLAGTSGKELIFHVLNPTGAPGASLNVGVSIAGAAGFIKADNGNLVLGARSYATGQTTVNGGTLTLNAGPQTLFPGQNLAMNFGGALNLNGNAQLVGDLYTSPTGGNEAPQGGGAVTGTAAAVLVANQSNNARTYAGAMSGGMTFAKAGFQALTLTQDNTYTGQTLITGGTVTLSDAGRLSGTTGVVAALGTLNFGNTGLANNNDRLNDAAPITLRAGGVTMAGRAQADSVETLGNLTLAAGNSQLNVTLGGTGIHSAVLAFGNLSQSSPDGVTNFQTAAGALGTAGRITFANGPALVANNILPVWIESGGNDFATYIPGLGIAPLGAAGGPGYDVGTTLPAASNPAGNYKPTAASTVPTGGLTVNTLNINGAVGVTFASPTDVLNLNAGGLMKTGASGTLIGSAVDEGRLTAGGTAGTGTVPLYVHNGVAGNSLTINSRVIDNPNGAAVRVVVANYNAGAVVATNPDNSYTGGTSVNGWVNSSTGGYVLSGATPTAGQLALGRAEVPAGGLTLNNSAVTMVTNPGQIHPSNTVTLAGQSTLTLVGANTLNALAFDNFGGTTNATVNTGGVLTLSAATPISVTSQNPASVPTVAGTLDFGGAAKSIAVDAIKVNGVAVAPLTAGANVTAVIQNAGQLTKTGTGNLQLSGQSTFAGGVLVQTGGLILGASSTPTLGGTITSGPVGTGALTVAPGATLLASTAVTLANPLVIQGDLNFAGLNNLTFNGTITLPGSPFTVNVAAPQQTVSMLGTINGSTALLTKTGLGSLVLTSGSAAGTVNLPDGGPYSMLSDGDGTGTANTLAFPGITAGAAVQLTTGRLGTTYAPLFATASNKVIAIPSLDTAGNAVLVNNNNGYGIQVTGGTAALTGADPMTYNVVTATASNVTQGLTIDGQLTGPAGVAKQGAGTLVLTNAANSFGGAGKAVDVQAGVVAAPNDGALGNAANGVVLNANAAAAAGFRATGTFSTARTFTLNQAANAIEVTAGNNLTLTNPLAVTAAGNVLTKNDNGVLTLAAANPGTWTGGVTINAGAVRAANAGAFGATTAVVTVASSGGSALQLAGVNLPNPVTFAAGQSGINSAGGIQAVSGTSTTSGLITQTAGFVSFIGADAGATLNVAGGISSTNSVSFNVGAGGTVNVTTTPLNITGGNAFTKLGAGTLNVQTNNAAQATTVGVSAGTLVYSGAGVAGTAANAVTIAPGGTLTLDNAGTATANRLGGKAVTFQAGALNLIGNGSGVTAEALGAPTFSRGQTTITVDANGGGGTNLTFTAASNNVAPAQTTAGSGATVLFRGSSLGTAAGAGVATIQSTTGGILFNGSGTGATGSTNKAIIPWALIDTTTTGLGSSFATGDAAAAATNTVAILRPLAAGEYNNTATFTANTNMLLTAAQANVATSNVNSLTFDTGGSLALGSSTGTGAAVVGNTLNVSSGGILVRNGVTTTIGGGILSAPGTFSPFSIHTPGTADLTVTSLVNGGNAAANVGLTKAGGGRLTLSTPTATVPGLTAVSTNTINWQTVVNQGTLVLNGGRNTLGMNNYLEVGPGGTVDLNGSSQYVQGLYTDGGATGIATVTAGGTVTNTAAGQATLVANSDARNWAGQITGNVFFNRTGTATATTVFTPQTYTGGTLINGGTVSLRDAGAITASSGIDLNYASLTLDNSTGLSNASGRLGSVPLTLRGGTLTYLGRAQTASAESVGTVSFARGLSTITVTAGGTGVNSADLTVASVSNAANPDATLNVTGASNTIGTIGSQPRLLVAAAPALTNNMIGGWAIDMTNGEFLSYVPGLGVGTLVTNGFSGFEVNQATFPASAAATANLRITGASAVPAGGLTVNSLSFRNSFATTFTNATDVLNLTSGGLSLNQAANSLGATVDSGRLTAGGSQSTGTARLYLYQASAAYTINSRIVDNPNGASVRVVMSMPSGSIVLTDPANSYTGGTVVNGGTLTLSAASAGSVIPAGGLQLNAATATLANNRAGQIDPANTVTLNGGSVLNLLDNNTLAGVVINNEGGTAAPAINTFQAGTGAAGTGTGTLTIGAGGVTASSSNVATTAILQGRIDTGAAGNTLTVNPITVNGVAVAPLSATLGVQGWVGSAGAITKAGAGVLQLNSQQTFTGPLTVTAGGVNIGLASSTGLAGTAQGGSRYSALTLNANTWLNLAGQDATFGSLAGAGTVINVAPTGAAPGAKTLNVGFDNTSTTFAGSIARWNDVTTASIQLNKIGTGTLTLTGASSSTQNLQVSGGGVTFGGGGTGLFANAVVGPTGVLTLDNGGTNLNNRLGGTTVAGTATATVLAVVGGEFRLVGNAAAATTEAVGTISFNTGTNPNGASTITLLPAAGQPLALTTNNAFGALSGPATGLIRGVAAAPGAGLGTVNIGTAALGAPAGAGAGGNGTVTMPIRPDLLGDASATGAGTAFVTKDSANNTLRPLTAAEQAPASAVGGGAAQGTVNYALASAATVGSTVQVGSLALNAGGALNVTPSLMPATADGLPVNPQVVSGGILAQAGNTGITAGRLQTANNTAFAVHAVGNLTVNAVLNGSTGGLTKADAGTLTLGAQNLYTGQNNVNGGTLRLAGGDNTLPAFVTAGAPSVQALGAHSGAVVDLNGTNQLVGTLFTNGIARYANTGGVFTNLSATPSNLTTSTGTAFAFGGRLEGNLTLNKVGAQNLTLASPNTFTGATNVRGATLTLIDAGTLQGTSGVNVNYAGLTFDQSGLNPVGNPNPTRLPAATPVTLRQGTFTLVAGGSMDAAATVNTVTAAQGHSTISVTNNGVPAGSTSALSIGNLVVNPDATVNLVGGTSGFFSNALTFGSGQMFITSINGTPIPANITNKILPANIITNNGEFATYIQSGTTGSGGINYGVVTMNATTAGGPSATYDLGTLTGSTANSNVRLGTAGTAAVPAGGIAANVVAVRAAVTGITFTNAGDVLNLTSGGLALTNGGTAVGTAALPGVLTAGGTATGTVPLYVHNNGANSIVSTIANNSGGGQVRLVANVFNGTLTLAPTANNTYAGGTVVNGGATLALTNAFVNVPAGGLTINNSTVTTSAAGQIAAANDVTINGGGVLTLGNVANTLNGVSFNNVGGTAVPTVNTGTTGLTLSAAAAVTAVNDNAATVPTVAGTALILSNAAPTLTASTTANVPTNLVVSAPITSAGGPVAKAGTGSVVLSGASTFTTGVNLNAGAIILGASSTPTTGAVTSGPLGTGALTMAAGTSLLSDGTLRTVANNLALNGDVTFGSSAAVASAAAVAGHGVVVNGTVSLGAATRTINVNSFLNTTTFGGVVSGGAGAGINKTGPGTLVLSAVNTFDGPVTLTGGTLQAGVAQSLGGTGPTGPAITFAGGVLQHGTANTTDYSSRFAAGADLRFYIDTNGASPTYVTPLVSTGGGTIGKFGAGTLVLQDAPTYAGDTNVVGGTLQYGNAATTTAFNLTSTALYNGGTFYFNPKTADTVAFGGGNGPGGTTIDFGTVRFTGNAAYGGTLTFGSANTVTTTGTLDLAGASATFGGLTAQTNAAAANVLNIPAGQTLTNTGNVAIGSGQNALTTTVVNGTGGGSWVVNNPAASGTFVVGGVASAAGFGSRTTLDLSGLGNLTVALDPATGVVRVNPVNGTNNVSDRYSVMVLPSAGAGTTTITANDLRIGDGSQFNSAAGQINQVRLGSGVNTLNVNAINIGVGGRDLGQLVFNGATGSLVVRNAAGTGRAAVNIGTGTANTGTNVAGPNNVFDTTGHPADLLFGAVSIGTQPRTANYRNDLAFDNGTLDMTSLTAATKGTGANTTTVNVNFGTSPASTGVVTIGTGILQLGQSTGTSGTATGTVTVAGGTVAIGATSGVAVTMGSATTAGGTGNGTLALTGGTTTVAGDIVRGGGAGTSTAVLTLSGGTLDMLGNRIGGAVAANNLTSLTFAAGTLANAAEINNGAGLTKTTTGVLTLLANGYSGGTTVTTGTLLAMNAGATSATGTGPVTVNGGGTLGGVGRIAGAVTANLGSAVAPGAAGTNNGIGTLTVANAVSTGTGGTGAAPVYAIDINAAAAPTAVPGVENDVLALTGASGTLDLTQPDALNVTALNPVLTPTTYTIATFTSLAPTSVFDTVLANGEATQSGDVNAPNYVLVTYNANNIQLTVNNVVPEPTTLGGLGLAAIGLLARRRRRAGGR